MNESNIPVSGEQQVIISQNDQMTALNQGSRSTFDILDFTNMDAEEMKAIYLEIYLPDGHSVQWGYFKDASGLHLWKHVLLNGTEIAVPGVLLSSPVLKPGVKSPFSIYYFVPGANSSQYRWRLRINYTDVWELIFDGVSWSYDAKIIVRSIHKPLNTYFPAVNFYPALEALADMPDKWNVVYSAKAELMNGCGAEGREQKPSMLFNAITVGSDIPVNNTSPLILFKWP